MKSSADEIASLYQHYRALDITPYVTQLSQKPHGFGGLANVHTAMWFMPYHERPQKVAVKLLRCASVPDKRVIKRLRKEIGVWRRLEHANIQQLSGLRWSNSGLPAMVSIWHDYGDINSYIARIKPRLTAQTLDEKKMDLFADVARGLEYLHRNGVIHADIKGANVLVSADRTARLCDFGFSWILAGDALSFSDPSSTLKGTVRWMAPELVDDDAKHTKESDIWAYGCLLLEVQGECRPYYNKTNDVAVYVALGQKLQPSRPQALHSDAVWALVLSCCKLDSLQRPRADQLLGHCERLRRSPSVQPKSQSRIVGDKQQPRSAHIPSAQGVRVMKGSERREAEPDEITFAKDDEPGSPWFAENRPSASPSPRNMKGTSAYTAAVGRDGLEYEEPDARPSWRRVEHHAGWDSIDTPSANPAWRRGPPKGPASPVWRHVSTEGPRLHLGPNITFKSETEAWPWLYERGWRYWPVESAAAAKLYPGDIGWNI